MDIRRILSVVAHLAALGAGIVVVIVILTALTKQTAKLVGRDEKTTDNINNNITQSETINNDLLNNGEEIITNPTQSSTTLHYVEDGDPYAYVAPNSSQIAQAKIYDGNYFELPVNGSTGFATVALDLNEFANGYPKATGNRINAGTAFVVLQEDGAWWEIMTNSGLTGWVDNTLCMINLPDVIPSIVYKNTNAYSSAFTAYEGQDIQNVTGLQLYKYSNRADGRAYNARLKRDEYIMPVLYEMAKHIYMAQQYALMHGETLVLYEGYRPLETQNLVVREMRNLINQVPSVQSVGFGGWGISWFIATGKSNHQEGYAIDVSLGSVSSQEERISGEYKYKITKAIEYYDMPSPIHELSKNALTFTGQVTIQSTTAWQNAKLSPGMLNSFNAQNLQKYCTNAGLTPLASEWWHFNDWAAYELAKRKSDGNFVISECLSKEAG